ncbi:hypothetical protein [Acidithiobacillus sulfuriphilus]|uniref:Uncharacterized protein n=2 Tax=Acidithiobacillus sulfuriphilus TaxID=1867749 RepID=A0A3M8R6G1_9PROT|nr:hypothetical protein [Acidithiobacillus sulfuriphilus]RNF63232.1 hypothetical protein EC580_06770 [Acidithiobacillus sulfuriphilus]
MRRLRFALLLGLALAPIPGWGAVNWSISNVPSYFGGDFHSSVHTGIFYDPTTLQAQTNNWWASLTIPYITITNLPNGAAYNRGVVVGSSKGTPTHNASGLGDILLSAHYRVYRGVGFWPSMEPYAQIKFGTASSTEGLGTGLTDYEIGSNFSENLGWIRPFFSVGYDFVGRDKAYPLRNILTYSVGTTMSVFVPGETRQSNFLTLLYSGSQSELNGYPSIGTVLLAWNHDFTPAGTGFQFYLAKGVTSSSPGFGVGFGFQVAL